MYMYTGNKIVKVLWPTGPSPLLPLTGLNVYLYMQYSKLYLKVSSRNMLDKTLFGQQVVNFVGKKNLTVPFVRYTCNPLSYDCS